MERKAHEQISPSPIGQIGFNISSRIPCNGVPAPKWLIKKIDKLRRNFFWKGEDVEGNKGGLCLVKWDIICKPKELGVLVFTI
jgi:hypothetical protein